jgi:hypothetical protein
MLELGANAFATAIGHAEAKDFAIPSQFADDFFKKMQILWFLQASIFTISIMKKRFYEMKTLQPKCLDYQIIWLSGQPA